MFTGTYPADRKPMGYRQLTVSDSAIGLSSATGGIPQGATSAVVVVESQPIRARDDGAAPTSSAGMPFAATSRIELASNAQIDQFKAIRSGDTDAVLNISYYAARKAY